MPAQPPGIGITHMVDPALHTGVEFTEADPAFAPGLETLFQAATGFHHLARLHKAMVRVDDEAEPGDAAASRQSLGAIGMNLFSSVAPLKNCCKLGAVEG